METVLRENRFFSCQSTKECKSFKKTLESVFRGELYSYSGLIRLGNGVPNKRWESNPAGPEHQQKGENQNEK